MNHRVLRRYRIDELFNHKTTYSYIEIDSSNQMLLTEQEILLNHI